MAAVWIESMHNLHCPTCDARLVQEAGRFDPMGRPDPVYVGSERLACRAGHSLPSMDSLYAYRDERGYPADAAYSEVPPPR